MNFSVKLPIFFLAFILNTACFAQPFTHADTLRGSITPHRSWWNVVHYNLILDVNIQNRSIKGSNTIIFTAIEPGKIMQIDLQAPLKIDSIKYHHQICTFSNEGSAHMVTIPGIIKKNASDSITVFYSGLPHKAQSPPWEGGFIWAKDKKDRPLVATACQGIGASIWWPNKDHQSDEPDNGMSISIITPDSLVGIANGNLVDKIRYAEGKTKWVYKVSNPINNYGVTLNIGKYVTVTDTFNGQKGLLNISYSVLDYNKDRALKHLQHDVKTMLRCFEYWFGSYPFYDDGYKLIETSFLGMEHQSAIAYGNDFRKGYAGADRSGTGHGLSWDYIVIHESGHEWFGNNITARDIADMWIQEGFTTYSEVLYVEYTKGKEAANEYLKGLRRNIMNSEPIIGSYNVNREGTGDMYDKGANMIHTIRQIIDNDSLFREILRGLTNKFGKTTCTGNDIEKYIAKQSGKNLAPVFDQYLRSKFIPIFEYEIKDKTTLIYRWNNTQAGFTMPVKFYTSENESTLLYPTEKWQQIHLKNNLNILRVDDLIYIIIKKTNQK